jgi:nucleotide-binding universal stress UspA family protein
MEASPLAMNTNMKVLLAVDDSGFSAAAARAVVKQFRAEDTEVCVLHAFQWQRVIPSCFAFARGDTYGAQFCSTVKQAREQAAALVASMAGVLRASGFRASTAVVEGDPLLAILGRAAEWGADLIVLGSHRRSGLDRVLFGSVSEKVAHRAACSVEIVRTH